MTGNNKNGRESRKELFGFRGRSSLLFIVCPNGARFFAAGFSSRLSFRGDAGEARLPLPVLAPLLHRDGFVGQHGGLCRPDSSVDLLKLLFHAVHREQAVQDHEAAFGEAPPLATLADESFPARFATGPEGAGRRTPRPREVTPRRLRPWSSRRPRARGPDSCRSNNRSIPPNPPRPFHLQRPWQRSEFNRPSPTSKSLGSCFLSLETSTLSPNLSVQTSSLEPSPFPESLTVKTKVPPSEALPPQAFQYL